MQTVPFIVIGLLGGILSGFLGVGGGILIVPALIYFSQMTQHQAQGTTLGVLALPVVFLAAWKYYTSGNLKLGIVPFICVGFVLGGWIGAVIADKVPGLLLRRCFGTLLLFCAIRMILGK